MTFFFLFFLICDQIQNSTCILTPSSLQCIPNVKHILSWASLSFTKNGALHLSERLNEMVIASFQSFFVQEHILKLSFVWVDEGIPLLITFSLRVM